MTDFWLGFLFGVMALFAAGCLVMLGVWLFSGDSSFGGPPPPPPGYRHYKGRNIPLQSPYAREGLPQPSPPPPPKKGKFADIEELLDKLNAQADAWKASK